MAKRRKRRCPNAAPWPQDAAKATPEKGASATQAGAVQCGRLLPPPESQASTANGNTKNRRSTAARLRAQAPHSSKGP